MRIENSYEQSLSVARSLNTSLTQAQGAQFALLLSLVSEPLYAQTPPATAGAVPATPQVIWEADEPARALALQLNHSLGQALQNGNAAHFLLTRALTEEFPQTQQVTALRQRRAVAAYQAAAPEPATAETIIEQLHHAHSA